MAKTLIIGGKEYPIKATYRAQRYAIEKYPQEKLSGMTLAEAHDYTLDLTLQILAGDPKPFETIEELMDALSSEEFNAIDAEVAYIVFGREKPEAPGKQ